MRSHGRFSQARSHTYMYITICIHSYRYNKVILIDHIHTYIFYAITKIHTYYICSILLTCSEFIRVKIQANASELLLTTNSKPSIHVPPSNGNSAAILVSTVLYNYALKYTCYEQLVVEVYLLCYIKFIFLHRCHLILVSPWFKNLEYWNSLYTEIKLHNIFGIHVI